MIFVRLVLSCIFIFSSYLFGENGEAAPSQTTPAPQENFLEKMEEAPVGYEGAFTKMMLTMLALIALIVISVWMLRRIASGKMRGMNMGHSIKILERRPLSAKSVLYVIEVKGKKIILAESQVHVRKITHLDEIAQVEE